ncbi:sensor histidine kinase [Sphingomonas mucosissima]|uniref:histidine kinase n=1 Tax=Sphingomonas mucosissima TaxID=370959 RepID=A0A245ZLQ2_9SPHN|nr:ATP-binding protein [Sphingomonas mucosissima]OWK30674.1 Non-motile and phage-resistance protein [Sphingomonas mucosissima]
MVIDTPTFTATLDGDDRLVDADPSFAALNARAGGALGERLAAPPLASLVRLARRLGVPIARAVTIADADQDLDCWVRAAPAGNGVALALSLIRERPAWRPSVLGAVLPPPPGGDWTWSVDAKLKFEQLLMRAGMDHGLDRASVMGQPLTKLFSLESSEEGALSLLEAVASLDDFSDQPAVLNVTGTRVLLAGHVRLDRGGGFGGFVGATYHHPSPASAPDAEIGGLFHHRLDTILRRPLGQIVANADSINAGVDGDIDPQYADYAADIASAGRHLMGLIDDLSDIEAIEREDFTVDDEGIDLADVTRRAAGLLSVRAANAGVTIDRGDLDSAMPAHGEFRRTLQILVNLIGNAVRYSPRNAIVWLRLQRDNDRVYAIVADQGKGIALDDQERIFAKFERVDTSEPGGSGLGLYIARRLARAMGGDLTVDSAPGEGARFVLSLPAA